MYGFLYRLMLLYIIADFMLDNLLCVLRLGMVGRRGAEIHISVI